MARFTPRLAAGVGVLVAFLLLGGSATVAVADPGRSHSDRGNSSDRGNGDGNGSRWVGSRRRRPPRQRQQPQAGRGRRGRQRRTGQPPEPGGSVRVGACRPRRHRRVGAKPRRRQERRRGRQLASGIGPCRRRRCRRVGAKPRRRLGRIAFEWTRRERVRRIGAAGSPDRFRLLSSRCPERTVQSAALDARQRAHARHPARRVRTAIAGPCTPTGARCATACASTPALQHRRRRGW